MVSDVAEPALPDTTFLAAEFWQHHWVDGHPRIDFVLTFFAVVTLSGSLPGGGNSYLPGLDSSFVEW